MPCGQNSRPDPGISVAEFSYYFDRFILPVVNGKKYFVPGIVKTIERFKIGFQIIINTPDRLKDADRRVIYIFLLGSLSCSILVAWTVNDYHKSHNDQV